VPAPPHPAGSRASLLFVADTFELFGPARYTPAGGATFSLLAMMASDVYERRIIPRPRPYVDGAPLDDTGALPDALDLTFLFAERGQIPGVNERNYPDYHARFLRDVRVEGTGTLYFPGRGEKRVRLKRMQSQQVPNERNCEAVTCNFLVDAEDERATAGSFVVPTSKLATATVVRQFLDDGNALGMGGDLLESLEDLAGALEAAANSPFDAAADIEDRAARVTAACKRIEKTLSTVPQSFGALAYAPLLPAEAIAAASGLKVLQDVAAAQRGALLGEGSQRQRVFTEPLSIFEIAARLGKNPDDLIRANPRADLFRIPAGVQVWT